ncbi:MAG: thymidine phosphorylase [Myxococcaceae bacterium]|nr:thymidine phosphorylase [Myxococcaceae bacterium]
MHPYELIKRKRDGGLLEADEIAQFIAGYTEGIIPDYQMAAMCMSIFFNGLTDAELAAWAGAMLRSGEVIDLSDVPALKVDKHSTGGVGDKVSLSLAPLAAACGVPVPMISGRGLGHTGGTLDKLESIPGFRVDLGVERYRELVRTIGCCLIGQTSTVVPADKKLYALRDVTATVDCIPLIASSIMSKKLAEGIDALVLDVKVGSGAFMKTLDDARKLATTMVGIGREMGKKVVAIITDMEQPLGRAIGNSLEAIEAIDMLKGQAPADYTECTMKLTAKMLELGQAAKDETEARARLQAVIDDGSALKKFAQIIEAQGGNPAVLYDYSVFPTARQVVPIPSPVSGYITAIDTEKVGMAAVALGAGRERVDSIIDPAVGFVLEKKVGDKVEKGEPLAMMHINDAARAATIIDRFQSACAFGDEAPTPRPLIIETIE